jgi:hypothetical protein
LASVVGILQKRVELRLCRELLSRSRSFGFRSACAISISLVLSAGVSGASDEPVRVQAEVGNGPYFVGQGVELRITVVGRRQRPKIDFPSIAGASAWLIGTDVKAISRSGIGSIVGEENLFVTRFRVVPRRTGTLQIPSVPVRVEERSGRTPISHIEVLPVPAEGRPAVFLGGVGRFAVHAEVSAKVVRVGQEFDFRVTVTGPAAWGMTGLPELTRYDRLPLALRIRPGPTELKEEPPRRTYTYRLRPSRAGEGVLPPISIASFEPSLSRFMTQVTPSVAIRVVAVSAFDPASIDDGTTSAHAGRSVEAPWIVGSLSAIALAGALASLTIVRRRLRLRHLARESAARRYAARLARSLASDDFLARIGVEGSIDTLASNNDPEGPDRRAARRVSDLLIHYLQLAAERPPGALTPEEASQGVRRVSRSADLGAKAGRLVALSDRVLYGEARVEPGAPEILKEARALFEALGTVKTR